MGAGGLERDSGFAYITPGYSSTPGPSLVKLASLQPQDGDGRVAAVSTQTLEPGPLSHPGVGTHVAPPAPGVS